MTGALTDHRDPRWTPAQLAHLARFEAAEVPVEVVEAAASRDDGMPQDWIDADWTYYS